jgi:hypothetical protein
VKAYELTEVDSQVVQKKRASKRNTAYDQLIADEEEVQSAGTDCRRWPAGRQQDEAIRNPPSHRRMSPGRERVRKEKERKRENMATRANQRSAKTTQPTAKTRSQEYEE